MNSRRFLGYSVFAVCVVTATIAVAGKPPALPVEFHLTLTGSVANDNTLLWAFDHSGTAVGRSYVRSDNTWHAIRWTAETGLEDISSLIAPWFDYETGLPADGNWLFRGAYDINEATADEAAQIAGYAWNGVYTRAAVYYEGEGYFLLPRRPELPDWTYWIQFNNASGEVQGVIQPPVGVELPYETFLWTPRQPEKIDLIDDPSSGYPGARGIGNSMFMTQNDQASVASLYTFTYDTMGTLSHTLTATFSTSDTTCINDSGAFAFVVNGRKTQAIKLYRPGQSLITVHESSNFTHSVENTINNSSDFVYQVQNVPYLYRFGENKSYRLYDLCDSAAKSVLFVSSAGDLKSPTLLYAVIADDNVAGVPAGNEFDRISGGMLDPATGKGAAFVLTPAPRQ